MTATRERPDWRDWPELRVIAPSASPDSTGPAHVEDWLQSRYAAPRPTVRPAPRVPLARRLTSLGRAAWWVAERLPVLTALLLIALLVAAYLRDATP